MSGLPEGAVLTSISGRKCTAIPRNVTNPEEAVEATGLPIAEPSEDATGELPPGGILMEAPVLSREFPSLTSLVSSIITSIPNPASTESLPDPAASPPPGFRLSPDGGGNSEEETGEDGAEEPASSGGAEQSPAETAVIGQPLIGEGEAEENVPPATSEASTEETSAPEDPDQGQNEEGETEGDGEGEDEESNGEDDQAAQPTLAPVIGEDGTTQSADSPKSTGDVGSESGSGSNFNEGGESNETGDGEGTDPDAEGEDGDTSSDGNESVSGESDNDDGRDSNNNDDKGSGDNNDNDDDEGSGSGAGAVPSASGAGDSFITTTLGNGVATTIPAPSGSGSGRSSPSDNPDNEVAGSANGNDEAKQAGIIAGSVVGSLVAVALIGLLLFWFWRKKGQRHKYVIQTPVFEPPNSGTTEKTWDFDNGSIGPTNKTARMKEAVEYRFDAIGRKLSRATPPSSRRSGVPANRGNSQFFAAGALAPRSRDNADIRPDNDELSYQDRFGNWWSRTREDANFNWSVRNDAPESSGRSGPARGIDRRTSEGHDFSSALGLMINDARSRGNDPFSDDFAISRVGHSEGYAVHQTPPLRNPFADNNAIQPLPLVATSYDPRSQQRRSTTGSVNRHTPSPLHRQASSPFQRSDTTTPLSRQQIHSPLSRGAVRSDQFDLEIEPHPGTLIAMPEEVSTREGTREGSMRSFTSRISSLSDGDSYMRDAMRWADEKSPGIGKAS